MTMRLWFHFLLLLMLLAVPLNIHAAGGPNADAGGPYMVNEGERLTLDGSDSSDPDLDTLSFAWDLDGDGEYDDATNEQPTWIWMNDGVYSISLKVSDSLLDDEDTALVTVKDLAPAADFTWAPVPQAEGEAVSFTDVSSSYPDVIVSWAWDFGGLGSSGDVDQIFTFMDDGIYTVTLLVTDEDGSTDTIAHEVTITDMAPEALLWGDPVVYEEAPGHYDAGGSISSPDAIVYFEWDWDYDGVFDPSGDTGAVQTHSWGTAGLYTVAVRVTDDDGSTDIATMVVAFNDANTLCGDLDGDNDVDGSDLTDFISQPGRIGMLVLTGNFGRTDCP